MRSSGRWQRWVAGGVLLIMAASASALAPRLTGVVVLHGKGAEPANMLPVADALRAAGYQVDVPPMPWAGSRNYDQPYPEALDEVDHAVNDLRGHGCSQIVLVGYSLGGNISLRYAARANSLRALVLIDPAHFPEGEVSIRVATDSLQKARAMQMAGSGAEFNSFTEAPTGRPIRITAANYLSYYDPAGPSAMSGFVSSLAVPSVVWIGGTRDPATHQFELLVMPHFPRTTQVQRVAIDADHVGAPAAAASAVVRTIRELPDMLQQANSGQEHRVK